MSVVYANPYFDVLRHASAGPTVYSVAARDSALVVGRTTEGLYLFVEGSRFLGPEGTVFEMPGGVIEKEESPLAAAVRETREETGFVVTAVTGHTALLQAPAISSARCHVFGAVVEHRGRPSLEPSETWEPRLIHASEIDSLVSRGLICDSITFAALALFGPASDPRARR